MENIDPNEVIESESNDGRPLARLAIGGGVASAGLLVGTATGLGGQAVHHMLSLATVVAMVTTAVFGAATVLRHLVCQVHRREMVAAEARHRAEMRELIVWHSDRLGEAEERYAQRVAELQEACQRERDQHRADVAAAEDRHAVDLRHHLQVAERAWSTQLEVAKGQAAVKQVRQGDTDVIQLPSPEVMRAVRNLAGKVIASEGRRAEDNPEDM